VFVSRDSELDQNLSCDFRKSPLKGSRPSVPHGTNFWQKSFNLDDVKLAELSNNSFDWKNVTLLRGQNLLWPLLHIFMGPGLSTHPQDLYAPAHLKPVHAKCSPHISAKKVIRAVKDSAFRTTALRYRKPLCWLVCKALSLPCHSRLNIALQSPRNAAGFRSSVKLPST